MTYKAKEYKKLIGIKGLSDTLLEDHFTLYQGYVSNANKMIETLEQMLKNGRTVNAEYAELKRRFGWEFNGMRLHEYYFENLGGKKPLDQDGVLGKQLQRDFGSYEMWEKDFRATGSMRGLGWVVLYEDLLNGRLYNFWINEHDVAHPSGCNPLLVMDVFEHAFLMDFGLRKTDYIEAFFKIINWPIVESRLKTKKTKEA